MATTIPPKKDEGAVDLHPTILVVEDNPDDFFFLQRAFAQSGVRATVSRAADGMEGRAFLERTLSGGQLPLCIVADLAMPVMDGFEFLAYVKASPAFRAIPVVILSASSNQRDITRAYQLGVNSYIVKPSSFEALLSIANALRDQWLRANIAPEAPCGGHP